MVIRKFSSVFIFVFLVLISLSFTSAAAVAAWKDSYCADCAIPWGGSIHSDLTIQAYSTSSVPCGSTCPASEIRTCFNGTFTGSYTYSSCTVGACCTPDCGCASNTCQGSSCSDGCGGSCAGTKSCPSCDNNCYACGYNDCGNYCWDCPPSCDNNCYGCGYNACGNWCWDCPPSQWCGDGSCNNGETCSSCPGDCGGCQPVCTPNCGCASSTCASTTCSDGCGGSCQGTITYGSGCGCPDDLGGCPGGCAWVSRDPYDCHMRWEDCPQCSYCGDGICPWSETCDNCPQDCGYCLDSD